MNYPTRPAPVPARLREGDGYIGAAPLLGAPLARTNAPADRRSPARRTEDATGAHIALGRFFKKSAHKALGYILGYGLNTSFKELTPVQLDDLVAFADAAAHPVSTVARVEAMLRSRVFDVMHTDVRGVRVVLLVYVDAETKRRMGLAHVRLGARQHYASFGPAQHIDHPARVLAYVPLPDGTCAGGLRTLRDMAERALSVVGELDEARQGEVAR